MLSLELTPADPGQPGTKLVATLRNVGKQAVLVNTRLGISRPQRGGELYLEVSDSAGHELPFTARVNIGTPDASYFKQLQPGESVERPFDLSTYFSLADHGGPIQIVATYSNRYPAPDGQTAWQEEIQAAPLSIALGPASK